ncbi:MAG: nuclease-related domain-containing protein [Halioglobus sp.]
MLKLIPFLIILVPLVVCGIAIIISKRRYNRFANPLTKAMRRPPGAQLGRELGAEQLECGFSVAELVFLSMLPISVFMLFQERLNRTLPLLFVSIAVIIWIIWSAVLIARIINRFHRIRQLRLGYECELAVGQELDLLMLNGFRIFHDVPAENFNIDHIVIGPTGVFAVETKGRSKVLSENGKGKKQFRAVYKDGVLQFPNGLDRETVPQAIRQAKWATRWLSQATGQPVQARPLVILPGWFIENQYKPDVPVIASGYIQGYFLAQKQVVLSEKDIAQIVYQIDQKVRDLEPGEVVRPLPVD